MTGRKVAILFDEGSDMAEIDTLTAAVTKAGGSVFTIAPKRHWDSEPKVRMLA